MRWQAATEVTPQSAKSTSWIGVTTGAGSMSVAMGGGSTMSVIWMIRSIIQNFHSSEGVLIVIRTTTTYSSFEVGSHFGWYRVISPDPAQYATRWSLINFLLWCAMMPAVDARPSPLVKTWLRTTSCSASNSWSHRTGFPPLVILGVGLSPYCAEIVHQTVC